MPKLKYQTELFSDTFEEIRRLLPAHRDELVSEENKELFILNPDVDTYTFLEQKNKLVVITARDEGVLVGYFSFTISPHLHYKNAVIAAEDVHYLAPEYRRGMAGVRLIKFAEAEAKRRGADMMVLRTKVSHNHGKIFTYLGYSPMDIVHTKRL